MPASLFRKLGLVSRIVLSALLLLAPLPLGVPPADVVAQTPPTYLVMTTEDAPDATPGDTSCASNLPSGPCTLRAAIQEANTQSGGATILLAGGRDPLTYTLASGSGALLIQQSLTLQTPNDAGLRVVDGSNLAQNNPIFDVVSGTVVIAGLTIHGAPLSGIANRSNASLTLLNSTLSGNRNAGLLNDGGVVRIVNSTFSGNSGSGLYNQVNGQMQLSNVTVVSNTATTGGGLFNMGTLTATHTLIAGNSATSQAPDCSGAFVSGGYNLIGNTANCTGFNAANNDLLGVAPVVGLLRDNGGPARTHALLSGSPARDAGQETGCRDHANLPITTDARGVVRPQGSRCDIGAYEVPLASFAQPAFAVSDSAPVAVIQARLDATVPFGLAVQYATGNGTAQAGVDYLATSGTMTGTSTMTFTVPITGSPLYTGDRSFNVALSVPPGAGLGTPSTATVTIVDSQPPPQTLLASDTYTTLKSAGAVTALVVLDTISGVTATVNYATVNGTAQAGVDFAPASGTLVFPPGQTTRPITLTLLNANVYTGDKAFTLALSQPVSATLGAPGTATIQLVDDNPRRVYLPVVARGPDFYVSPCETEPNNLVAQANGPLQSGRPVCGAYNGVNVRDDDYFYFENRNSGPIRVRVDNAVSGLQVQLYYQSTSNFVGFSASPPFEILYPTGAPGRYYVRVVMPSGYRGGTYSLTVTYP